MAGYQCPFCKMVMIDSESNENNYYVSFEHQSALSTWQEDSGTIRIEYHKCPNCNEISIYMVGLTKPINNVRLQIHPKSTHNLFPTYIPQPIRDDYEEAHNILALSPKASATLARRCLQGMIRDFWNVTGKKNLKQEIDAIQNMVHPEQWKVIHAVRQLGNVGAHMEEEANLIVDIDPGEAEKLIKLIELLMHDWYIRRHEQQHLYSDILEINDTKQEQRSPKE